MRVLPLDHGTGPGEADLTVSALTPVLPGATGRGNAQALPQCSALEGLLEHESLLFARYLRSRPTFEDPA